MKRRTILTSVLAIMVGVNAGALFVNHARAAQPNMHAALESLKVARKTLEDASADKGGHRAKAIKLVDDAIAEVKAGIDFDKSH